jgi:hypothetical protein
MGWVMDSQITLVMIGGAGLLLYLTGLAYPWVARKGPNNWIGIRTGSNDDPRVWALMHVKGEIQLLVGGYFVFLAAFFVIHLNISFNADMQLLLLFVFNIPILCFVLASVGTEGKCRELAQAGVTPEDLKPEIDKSFNRFFSDYLYFTMFVLVVVVLFLIIAQGKGVEGHTGLRHSKALESSAAWKAVQGDALSANIVLLVLAFGNLFFRNRDTSFKRMLVLANMLAMSAVVVWYYFI